MSFEVLPLALFCFTMTVTPGPNNLLLTATGANYGYRRCLPHILGALVSIPVMAVVVGAGLGQVFTRFPAAHTALDAVGSGYLVWLAWKVTKFDGKVDKAGAAKPLTFGQAALFQWLNPKCWMMYLGAVSLFTSGAPAEVLVMAGLFTVMVPPCFSCWAMLGAAVGRFLSTPARVRAFNWALALTLLATLILAHAPSAAAR
jgi:threonine/homoserine/homoserine lactone efflux protein